MSTYIYLTAEVKKDEEWILFKPLEDNSDWEGLTPPLIIKGGWPSLARKLIAKTNNIGAPPNMSTAFNDFQMNVLKNQWTIGWGMYSNLKKISFESGVSYGINNEVKLSAFFKNISGHKKNLRLIYWWA